MENNGDLFRLGHIKECIDKILELVEIIQNQESFEVKWIERDAMIRNFEIIGEASNHISKELKEKYLEVNWKEMKGMRNYISHEYFGLDLDNVWQTAIADIPKLKEQITIIILEIKL